jgi:hypothetical protein
MGDERYTTQRETSTETSTNRQSRPSSHSTSPHHAAYATERAKILFGSYRRGDANDPDAYVAAVAAVLSIYDPDLMREVTDPRTGIQTTEKYMDYMPNSGQIKHYCDGVRDRRDRLQRLGSLPPVNFNRERLPPPPPRPGDKATIFVPASNPRYPELLEWSKTADPLKFKFEQRPGIWVSYDTWDQRQVTARRIVRSDMPQRLELSEEAKRVMASVDAERDRKLPSDEAAE